MTCNGDGYSKQQISTRTLTPHLHPARLLGSSNLHPNKLEGPGSSARHARLPHRACLSRAVTLACGRDSPIFAPPVPSSLPQVQVPESASIEPFTPVRDPVLALTLHWLDRPCCFPFSDDELGTCSSRRQQRRGPRGTYIPVHTYRRACTPNTLSNTDTPAGCTYLSDLAPAPGLLRSRPPARTQIYTHTQLSLRASRPA